MSLLTPTAVAAPAERRGFRERRRERRLLAEQDRWSAERAEAHLLGGLLTAAAGLVRSGWTQHCWFVALGPDGDVRRVGPMNLYDLAGRTVSEMCLVGAVVQAGGGPGATGDQPVRRALDLTWATLYDEDVHRCPAPAVRLARVRDLTRWNDAPNRTAADVSQLLLSASGALTPARDTC